MTDHRIVTKAKALAARKALLAKEKSLTRARDDLARRRRALPWVRIDKTYTFDTPEGRRTLAELFGHHSQLIVQHFMFAPGWKEGCVGCSFNADHVDGAMPHVAARDAAFVAVSRAPVAAIERFRKRMGWRFRWVSSARSDFNYDFDVSFHRKDIAAGTAQYNYRPLDFETEDLSGFSIFLKDDAGVIYHTYSTFARGDEILCTAYMFIDLLPKGRDEDDLEYPMAWWRHHDRYRTRPARPATGKPAACCG